MKWALMGCDQDLRRRPGRLAPSGVARGGRSARRRPTGGGLRSDDFSCGRPDLGGDRRRPRAWTIAQKNGFAGRIINSVGWVDPPGEDEGYLVAILTYGWPNHPAGIEAVERISLLVADSMIDTVPGPQ